MKETLCKTKFLNLEASRRENGLAPWVYAHRPNVTDVAVIVPVLHKKDGDYTIFLTTKRPPITEEYGDKTCIEFPAGLVGDENKNETTLEALNKELLEETGYCAQEFTILSKNLVSSGGLTSEKSTLARADIYDIEKKAKPVTDGGVITGRVEIRLDEAKNFIKQAEEKGYFICAQTLAGLYFIL